jgi:glycosyltransferase involved in cell wall biosynthesis
MNQFTARPRLLHVIASMDPRSGGVCQAIRTTIPELDALGWSSEVVCGDNTNIDYQCNDSFALHRLGRRQGVWAYSKHLLPWLRTNGRNFDAIMVHGLWSYHSHATQVLFRQWQRSRRTNVPKLVVMPHGMLDPWFQRDATRRVKAWRNWLYWKLIEKNIIASADGMLFTCQREMELARETFTPYQPKKEWVVGLGVSEPPSETSVMQDALQMVCPEIRGRRFILFISRIHPKKGVDVLIEAYAQQAARNAETSEIPVLVIAGPKDSDYGLKMEKRAREFNSREGSGAAICFPGMLQGDAKWGAFYSCDAFVLPSHQENFGIAVVEALACGKPVLISDQINIYREIVNAGAGLVCADTADGVSQMVHEWFMKPEPQRVAMRDQARRCFVEFFRASNAARRLADALNCC